MGSRRSQPGRRLENGRKMSGRARTISGKHFAAALMGCTILAGLPAAALAQDTGAQDAAPPVQPPAANCR